MSADKNRKLLYPKYFSYKFNFISSTDHKVDRCVIVRFLFEGNTMFIFSILDKIKEKKEGLAI